MEKKILGNRKLNCLGNCVKKDDSFLHPITLTTFKNKNNDNMCPTDLYLSKNQAFISKVCSKNEIINNKDIVNFMALPYINLDIKIILNIYKVDTIDKLEEWFENSLESKSFEYINRILNIWIKYNFNTVKNYYQIFEEFYIKINNKFWGKKNKEQIKNIKKYIEKWFKIKKSDDFNFDLGNDLKKYLSK